MTLKSDLKKASFDINELIKGQTDRVSREWHNDGKFISLSALKKICERHNFGSSDLAETISEIEKEEKQ